jgi:hypothetical protein
VLQGDARPVVEGIPESRITGESSRDDTALAGAPGDRCCATKGPQGVIVSSPEGFPSLCEQRGEDDPTVSSQGCEDRSRQTSRATRQLKDAHRQLDRLCGLLAAPTESEAWHTTKWWLWGGSRQEVRIERASSF